MKKVLGWAIVAICIAMGAYFGLLSLGMPSVSAALTAATVAAVLTVAAFDASYGFAAFLAVVGVVLIGHTVDILAVVLSVLIVAFGAFNVASKLKVEFQWAFIAYLIEGAGIYATLKLGLWQPAAVAALLLGIWWFAVRLAQMRLVASI
ncbi:MAG: hypothetical protein RLY47_107 [Candidatus Parcubacteria bacterium]|jgi:hypothetical protein